MINVQGEGKVSLQATATNGGGAKMECDLWIDFGNKKELQLVAKDKVLRQRMLTAPIGRRVRFSGVLHGEEPGIYFIKLDDFEVVRKGRKG